MFADCACHATAGVYYSTMAQRTSKGTRALGAWMNRNGVSVAELARRLGVDYARAWRLVHGERGPSMAFAAVVRDATGGEVGLDVWARAPRKVAA